MKKSLCYNLSIGIKNVLNEEKIMNITEIKGIGEKKAKLFEKKGILTADDLIRYYPSGYEKYPEAATVFETAMAENIPLLAIVSSSPKVERKNGRCIVKVYVKDNTGGLICCTWFNIVEPILKNVTLGKLMVFNGKMTVNGKYKNIVQPDYYEMLDYGERVGTFKTTYPLTEKLTNNTVSNAISSLFEMNYTVENVVPKALRLKHHMPEIMDILKDVHYPKKESDFKNSNLWLQYEEMFAFLYNLKKNLKESSVSENKFQFFNKKDLQMLIQSLPYELTKDQKGALDTIVSDLDGKHLSNRLIQGDVGCGKTVVALLSVMYAATNNYQAALIAPTEVLAKQHYDEALNLIKVSGLNIKVEFLAGSTTKKKKEKLEQMLLSKEPVVVIGTHSVINIANAFTTLAVTVIDEQHKFGVVQRNIIGSKGSHFIAMTATPIPRTLSLAMFGNGSIAEIKSMPNGRLPVQTCFINNKSIAKAFNFINAEVSKGNQAYVVCPAIEENENVPLISVDEIHKMITAYLPNLKVAVVHGKTKAKEKEQIMTAYKNNEINVLISTTVIEVGVNVPNATVITIINAERFGLSTLHQLRGRVGRGNKQSYCILVDCLESADSRNRMEIMTRSTDGFEIAEADLRMRGPGELLGKEQSGQLKFKIAKIENQRLFNAAMMDAEDVVEGKIPITDIEKENLCKFM